MLAALLGLHSGALGRCAMADTWGYYTATTEIARALPYARAPTQKRVGNLSLMDKGTVKKSSGPTRFYIIGRVHGSAGVNTSKEGRPAHVVILE